MLNSKPHLLPILIQPRAWEVSTITNISDNEASLSVDFCAERFKFRGVGPIILVTKVNTKSVKIVIGNDFRVG